MVLYVLRSYFDTQLMLAESKGLVLRDYRTFWMGHKGDIENRYTTNKQRLPEEVIEDMRGGLQEVPRLPSDDEGRGHQRGEDQGGVQEATAAGSGPQSG